MLDFPDVIVTQFIGQRALIQGLLEQIVFAGFRPRAGQLMFVENAEFHDAGPENKNGQTALSPLPAPIN